MRERDPGYLFQSTEAKGSRVSNSTTKYCQETLRTVQSMMSLGNLYPCVRSWGVRGQHDSGVTSGKYVNVGNLERFDKNRNTRNAW